MTKKKILILTVIMFGNMFCISQRRMTITEQEALSFFVEHLVNDTFFKNKNIVIDEHLQDFPLNDWVFSDLSACETCDSLNPLSFIIHLEKTKIKIVQNWNHFRYDPLIVPELGMIPNQLEVHVTVYKKILTIEDEYVVLIVCSKKDIYDKKIDLIYYLFLDELNHITLCGRTMSFKL